ncbi:carbohydrate kinase family protein [Geodermatophilus marinus]|uniref:carbohydrate kinase family protein n=1 Tax=Geodermatophilus sp. LHW52908 TaxID=2303986 RepID=UPI000E3D51A0|nr:carbohydrate kinase [Geodermatophilus sp. LHW52908]RFU19336.1 carbohydrate kinase [Geodermatophilus sp. LHW52908]
MAGGDAVLSVLGELVVDLIPDPDPAADPLGTAPRYVARPGGNALNVAVAAGRLGVPVRLLARLGTGPLAAGLRRHVELAGVDPGGLVVAGEPVSLAVVGLGPDGSPDYGFHVLGAADWQWTDDELAAVLPPATAVLHVGSISSWTPPGCEAIARLVERVAASGRALVSVDPNIRPMLADGPVGTALGNTAADVRARLGRLLAVADVVKVSAEDLAWLEPEALDDLDAAAERWAARGRGLVVLTDGGAPLRVARPGRPLVHREPPRVTVVDTVGAGDSLAAGLFAGLLDAGVTTRAALDRLDDDRLLAVVDDAALVAALNCTRPGADPPTRAELAAARR